MARGAEVLSELILDVSFDHDLAVVQAALKALLGCPCDTVAQHAFCRALRKAKFRLFRVIEQGGGVPEKKALLAVVRKAAEVLPQGRKVTRLVRSIRRHIREIRQAEAGRSARPV